MEGYIVFYLSYDITKIVSAKFFYSKLGCFFGNFESHFLNQNLILFYILFENELEKHCAAATLHKAMGIVLQEASVVFRITTHLKQNNNITLYCNYNTILFMILYQH